MLQGREKQKKLKPIKQPTKAGRNLLAAHRQPGEGQLGASVKDSMSRKMQQSMGSSGQQSGQQSKEAQSKEPQITTLENVCTGLLEEGNVQSFIDLFYISHKCLPNVMKEKNYFGDPIHFPGSVENQDEEAIESYKQLGQTLAKAEVRHESMLQEKEVSMNEYNSMAFAYEERGDYLTSSYFYYKVIEIANSCNNKQFELIALLGLGKCFDQESNKEKAIELLEAAFDDASVLDSEEQRKEMSKLIAKELIQIYIKQASESQKYDLEVGLQAYESALRVAQRASQLQSEARISHKIGDLYYQEGKFHESIKHQMNYLELLRKSLDEEHEKLAGEQMGEKKDTTQEKVSLKYKQMEAHASLAKCYLKLKKVDQAEEHLNEYNRMAKEAKAQNSVADSSYYLAKLFEEKGDKEQAIHFYQSYFEAAKSEKPDKKDRGLVDRARVTLAIAKSNRNMDRYIGTMSQAGSLGKVLDWKIKKVLK